MPQISVEIELVLKRRCTSRSPPWGFKVRSPVASLAHVRKFSQIELEDIKRATLVASLNIGVRVDALGPILVLP